MPRPLRIQDAGLLHHVVCRGNDRQVIFREKGDFLYYLKLLEDSRQKFPIHIYNYCLMNNHLHLLVKPQEDGNLSKFMERVSKAYAKFFNRKYDHVGHVFQGRFKSFIVEDSQYFFNCCQYIDLNPVKACLVRDPEDYEWSGYASLAGIKKSRLKLDPHPMLDDLGETRKEKAIGYKAMILNFQGKMVDFLNRKAGILGDQTFRKKVKRARKR